MARPWVKTRPMHLANRKNHSRENPIREHAGIAVLQSGARRCFDQTFCGDAELAQASRPGSSIYQHRRFQGAHRRSSLQIDETSVNCRVPARRVTRVLPEVGNMPMPKKLLQRGITDLVRVSDTVWSGTWDPWCCACHSYRAPGGTLALVQNGDRD